MGELSAAMGRVIKPSRALVQDRFEDRLSQPLVESLTGDERACHAQAISYKIEGRNQQKRKAPILHLLRVSTLRE